MPEPLARDEDRAADVEAEGVVLERRAVPVAHQEADQALVRLVHLGLPPREGDAGAVDDGEVVGHRVVEADEAVVEDADRVVGDDVCGHGHGRMTVLRRPDVTYPRGSGSAPRAGRTLVAARVLPGRAAAGRVPRLLRRALRHGRAELDRLPAAERGSVPPLGGCGPGRVRVLRQVLARAARPRHDVPRARARARRPARAGAHRLRGPARRRHALVRRPAPCRRRCGSRGTSATSRGRRSTGSSASSDPAAEPFRYLRLREPPYSDDELRRDRQRRSATRRTSTSGTRTSRPRRRPWRDCGRSYSSTPVSGHLVELLRLLSSGCAIALA